MKKLLIAAALIAASTSAYADPYHGNVPDSLIGRWCNAWGEGHEGPRLYMRCKKSNIRELVEAEGYVYTVKITQGGTIEANKKCRGTDIYEWEGGPGYTVKLQCPNGPESWRVDIKDIETNQITIEKEKE